MALELPVGPFTLKAAATLATKQFRFVKAGSADLTTQICASSLDAPLGVLQNAPITNDAAELLSYGLSKLVLGATATVGDFLGTDANGAGVPLVPGTDTTKYVAARCLESGTAGTIVTALLNPVPHRAS